MRIVACLVFACLLAASADADVIHLKDGSRLQGNLKKSADGYAVTTADGKVTRVPMDAVKSVELSGSGAAGAGAKPSTAQSTDRLTSLRRSVQYLDDLQKIIDRYQTFLAANAGSAAESDARADLAMWQDRLDRGLVKVAGKWITPQERAALAAQGIATADAARKLLRDGQLQAAEDAINQALAQNPQNVAALYLRGVLAYRRDQLIPARKAFEAVNTLVANHAPTLNNLAVILFRQNQFGASLGYYDQAMQSSPRNRQVLDNVAEALNALPDEQRNTTISGRVLRRFTEQDQDLARQLLAQGLHRWGATWVTAEQLDQLRQAEQAVKDQLDSLAADFDTTKVRISNIDRDIDENNRAINRMSAASYVRGLDGNIYQTVPPASYTNLLADNEKLKREKLEQVAKLDQLRAAAKEIQRKLPVPKYSGIQKIFDVESTPIAPLLPTTKPTSLPITPPATQPLRSQGST